MAYEYEESNKQIVFTVDNESSMNQLNERIKELEEVYQKARLLDGIVISTKKHLSEQERKAKAFDEVKQYALSKNKDFEDRKDTARSNKEFNYFNTLQIANRAIINKCKQLEDKQND
ncbi:hypothetical protein [Staphylococcus nepalensis]|uniref:hypothetical protein n=1 Tax=Staphylococcus nepalensis TaxID=214473 RepID=UPI00301915E2